MNSCLNYTNNNFNYFINPLCSIKTNFIINLCFFNGFFLLNTNSNGGIILIDFTDSINFIFKSSFLNCKSNNGGALYINLPLYVKFQNNCFENCSANVHGQCIFCSNKKIGSLFELYYCLINKCPNSFLGHNSGIYIDYSECKLNNINYSNSKFLGWDIVLIDYTYYSEFFYLNSINICTSIILDYAGSSNGVLFKSNIINSTFNNHNTYNYFIWDHSAKNVTFLNSIFISNYFNSLTYMSKITFINCIYFDCTFIINNIEFYPSTFNNFQLQNCLFNEFTKINLKKKLNLNILIFFLIEI